MLNNFLLFLIAFGLCPVAQALPHSITVNDRGRISTIDSDKNNLVYFGSQGNIKVEIKKCNAKAIEKFQTRYLSLKTNYSSLPISKKKSKYDLRVNDGSSFSVVRGSEFGTWLRALPRHMQKLNLKSRLECRKQ
jgi:hypothetical protein